MSHYKLFSSSHEISYFTKITLVSTVNLFASIQPNQIQLLNLDEGNQNVIRLYDVVGSEQTVFKFHMS